MKSKHLYFVVLIITSGLLWSFILNTAHISGAPYSWSYLVRETLVYMGCWLTGYSISFFWLKRFGWKRLTQGLNLFDIYIVVNALEIDILLIISTAVIGAFFHTLYFAIQIVNSYSHLPESSRDSFGINLELFLTIFLVESLVFSFISLMLMLFGWLSRKLFESVKLKLN